MMARMRGVLLLLLVMAACDTAAEEEPPPEVVTVAGVWLANYDLYQLDICSPCTLSDELVLDDSSGVITGTARRAYVSGEADSLTFEVAGTRTGSQVLLSLIKFDENRASFAGDLSGEKLRGTYELLEGEVDRFTGFERLPPTPAHN